MFCFSLVLHILHQHPHWVCHLDFLLGKQHAIRNISVEGNRPLTLDYRLRLRCRKLLCQPRILGKVEQCRYKKSFNKPVVLSSECWSVWLVEGSSGFKEVVVNDIGFEYKNGLSPVIIYSCTIIFYFRGSTLPCVTTGLSYFVHYCELYILITVVKVDSWEVKWKIRRGKNNSVTGWSMGIPTVSYSPANMYSCIYSLFYPEARICSTLLWLLFELFLSGHAFLNFFAILINRLPTVG